MNNILQIATDLEIERNAFEDSRNAWRFVAISSLGINIILGVLLVCIL